MHACSLPRTRGTQARARARAHTHRSCHIDQPASLRRLASTARLAWHALRRQIRSERDPTHLRCSLCHQEPHPCHPRPSLTDLLQHTQHALYRPAGRAITQSQSYLPSRPLPAPSGRLLLPPAMMSQMNAKVVAGVLALCAVGLVLMAWAGARPASRSAAASG